MWCCLIVLRCTDTCFYYFDNPISISEARLNNRNTFVLNIIQCNSTANDIVQNDHIVEWPPLLNCLNIN